MENFLNDFVLFEMILIVGYIFWVFLMFVLKVILKNNIMRVLCVFYKCFLLII